MDIITHPEIITYMLKHADTILDWCREHSPEELAEHPILLDGCVFNLWKIGQLAKRPSEAFIAENNSIPWEALNQYGNELYENFPDIDAPRMFAYITHDLPPLREQLAALLEEITTTKG